MNRSVAGGKYGAPSGYTPILGDATVYVDADITEARLMSPCMFASPENQAGLYGITNMSFQMNLASDANRAYRSVKLQTNDDPPISLINNACVGSTTDSKVTFAFYHTPSI